MLTGFDYIAEQAKQNIVFHAGDYTVDGLLYCGICHTPKQCRIEIMGEIRMPYHLCKCEEAHDRKLQAQRQQERTERLRRACFPEDDMCNWKFETDDRTGDRTAMSAIKKYTENFTEMQDRHLGLLIHGDVGVGKSFVAACVANALIDNGYSCYMTSFSDILNQKIELRQDRIESLKHYDLLIIDDLAVERHTEYANEIITTVIESRCRSGKPMLVTTNLTPEQLTSITNDLPNRRVFSRLFKMTVPVQYTGTDRRVTIMRQNFQDVKDLLGL